MRIRYSAAENGRPVKKAIVYTADEHRIDRNSVDGDALRVIERLKSNGHVAYIVGGAVRDLLVGKKPKDFDIVTDATPTRIKRIFRNSRIIGRRFRLVHVFFGPVIYEVSTFRSLADGTTSNTFGTIEEDVLRRDFTFNALYYDPFEQTVVDYVGGIADIRRKRVQPVIPLKTIFVDDPVRMLRAAKYAATTGFSLPFLVRWKIKRQAPLLEPVSHSRLTEEILKIIKSGRSSVIVPAMDSLGLFKYLQPNAAERMRADPAFRRAFSESLAAMDEAVRKESDAPLGKLLAFMLRDYIDAVVDPKADPTEMYRDALTACRSFVLPMNPPRMELESAVRLCFRERGLAVRKTRLLERGRRGDGEGRGRRPADAAEAAPRVPVSAEPGGEAAAEAQKKRRKRRRRRKSSGSSAPSVGVPAPSDDEL